MDYQYPPFNDEFVFEDFVKDLFNSIYNDLSFQKYGTKGQKQHGIDIFSNKHKYVIQCKKKDIRKPDNKIQNELIKDINESLQKLKGLPTDFEYENFLIISTAKRYSIIQNYVNTLSKEKDFNISYWGWEDIQPLVSEFKQIEEKYYPHLISTSEKKVMQNNGFPKKVEIMVKESDEYLDKYEYDKALDIVFEAQKIINRLNDNILIAELNLKQAIILVDAKRDPIKARLLLELCLNTFENIKDKSKIAHSYYLIGITYIDEKKYKRAKATIEESLNVYSKLNDNAGMAMCLHQLGWIYDLIGELEKAIEFYEESLSKYLLINETDKNKARWGIASCYHHIGLIHRKKGNTFEIESNFLKAIEWYEKGDDKREIALVKYILAMHKFNEGDIEFAFNYLHESIHLYSSIGDHKNVLNGLSYASQIYYSCDDKESAMEVMANILDYSKENNILNEETGYYFIRTGKLFLLENKYNIAADYFFKAAEFFNEREYLLGQADTLIAYSDMAGQLDNIKEAIEFRKQAKLILKRELNETSNREETGVLAARIGAINEDIGEFHEALNFYTKAKRIFEESNSTYNLAQVLGNIVTCNRHLGDTKDEEEIFREILKLVDGTSFYYLKASALSNLADIEYEKKNLSSSTKMHEEACFLATKHNLPNKKAILDAYEKFKEKIKPSP